MKIIFFGTPEFAVPSLTALIDSGKNVMAVVTQPDKQSGRGRHILAGPVKAEAEKRGIKVLQPEKVKETAFIQELEFLAPSLVAVAAYGQILPPEIIRLPEFGCINVHASLLPQYRGAAPVNRAVINGDSKTGITIMLMDEGMDTGPVLMKEEAAISDDDTAGTLSLKLSDIGAGALLRAISGLEGGALKPVPQEGDASYAPMLKKTDGLIDWSRSAGELNNFIRGMNPWPGAYSFIDNERIKILSSASVYGKGKAGVIERITKDELVVGTGSQLLSIHEVQPSGKAIMPVKSYLQGRKLKEGMRFHKI
ncbi:MAG: methionyl-tRNA formyltransferase [Nitrospirae bacterium]|nr:methionyl-tRNA formyltransferase [Nitrospirota bacterium]